ncbi:MAG: hypothetical protein FWC64_09795 [Treponema sp.]|nr:hypothetical protein [Treponema sp.]
MKKLVPAALALAVVFLFASCPNAVRLVEEIPTEPEPGFRVIYHSEGHTSGEVPVDDNERKPFGSHEVMGPGTLQKDGHLFLAWLLKPELDRRIPVGTRVSNTGIVTEDVELLAMWIEHGDSEPPNPFFGTWQSVATLEANEAFFLFSATEVTFHNTDGAMNWKSTYTFDDAYIIFTIIEHTPGFNFSGPQRLPYSFDNEALIIGSIRYYRISH